MVEIGKKFLNRAVVCLNVSRGGNRWLCGDGKVGRRYVGESLMTSFVKSSGESQIFVVKNFNV